MHTNHLGSAERSKISTC